MLQVVLIIRYIDKRYLFAVYYVAFPCIPVLQYHIYKDQPLGSHNGTGPALDTNIKLFEPPTVTQSLTPHEGGRWLSS